VDGKNGAGLLLRSVWLSSDGEMMYYVSPLAYGGE